MNIFVLDGNLVRDPQFVVAKDGSNICKFTIANNSGYGEKKKTGFFDCVSFKSIADYINNYCKKGDFVTINGKITQLSWNDSETGKKRSKVEFIVNEVKSMMRRDVSATPGPANDQPADVNYDDDIPF